MDNEQLYSENTNTTVLSDQLPDMMSSITTMLAPFMLLSFGLTVVFIALYIRSQFRRKKLENAILDMQKTLHEMNERDKARSAPVTPAPLPPQLQISNEKIATIEQPEQKIS